MLCFNLKKIINNKKVHVFFYITLAKTPFYMMYTLICFNSVVQNIALLTALSKRGVCTRYLYYITYKLFKKKSCGWLPAVRGTRAVLTSTGISDS